MNKLKDLVAAVGFLRSCLRSGEYLTAEDDAEIDRVLEAAQQPVPMVVFCPNCKKQHIDAPDGAWTNPPHKSHLCHGCKTIWRSASIPNVGVAQVPRGDLDTWPSREGTMCSHADPSHNPEECGK